MEEEKDMKMMGFIAGLIASIPLLAYLILMGLHTTVDHDIWNEVIKHSDEFVFDHMSSSKRFVNMNLYDQDSTYVCEAFMDLKYKKVTIFKEIEVVGSSVNWMKSRKMYKLLYDKIPSEMITPSTPKKEVLKKLKSI